MNKHNIELHKIVQKICDWHNSHEMRCLAVDDDDIDMVLDHVIPWTTQRSNTMEKTYLGEGVYAEYNRSDVVLTVSDKEEVIEIIILSLPVIVNFSSFLLQCAIELASNSTNANN